MHLEYGNLVLIKPYDFHRREIVSGSSYERIVINIKDSYIDVLSSEETDLSACFHKMTENNNHLLKLNEQQIVEFTLTAQRLSQELESCEYGSGMLVDAYIKQILIMVNRIFEKKDNNSINNIMPSLVSNTIAYIEENITEEITLDLLSDVFHHNGTYISRCFKKITGIPLQQYIIQKRVTLAKKYLCEGCSPNKACFLSGFNDYSNFSRTFSKHTGFSPREFLSQNMLNQV
jgi:YesN/AraC family two-component response regulator